MNEKFPYDVTITAALNWKSEYIEASRWCQENFGVNWRYRMDKQQWPQTFYIGDPDDPMITFCFTTMADAVYFKLRWISGSSRSADAS